MATPPPPAQLPSAPSTPVAAQVSQIPASAPNPQSVQTAASSLKIEAAVSMPPSPWYNSTPIVGLLTLLGVVAGLAFNYFKMKVELKAAAEEANRERQASADEAHRERITAARKEVYSQLIDDFVQASKLVGELPSIDINDNPNYAAPLQLLNASVSKTWLVSEVETARKAREVHAKVQELFIKCIARMPQMQIHKDTIKECTATVNRANAKRDELLGELQRNAIFNNNNPEIQVRLLKLRAAQEGFASEAATERAEAAKQHHILVCDYMTAMLPELGAITNGVQDFMYSARLELGITGDNGLLQEQTADLFGRTQRSLNELMAVTGLPPSDASDIAGDVPASQSKTSSAPQG